MSDKNDRVSQRPDPSAWSDDELITLKEAAALFWPMGPLTTTSLRTAERDGILEVVRIAGKILTSKRSILKMSKCAAKAPRAIDVSSESGFAQSSRRSSSMPQSVAEFERMLEQGQI